MSKKDERMKLYNDLNEGGRALVDDLAAGLTDGLTDRWYRRREHGREGKRVLSFGPESGRELVIALLEHFPELLR